MHSTWILGGLALLAVVILKFRPKIFLTPVIGAFAAWSILKILLSLPALARDWFLTATLAKQAEGLERHARAASALWAANTEFRPAAREIFARVCTGYGISPHSPVPGDGAAGLDFGQPDTGTPARMTAAAAVEATRGKPVTKLSEAKGPAA